MFNRQRIKEEQKNWFSTLERHNCKFSNKIRNKRERFGQKKNREKTFLKIYTILIILFRCVRAYLFVYFRGIFEREK